MNNPRGPVAPSDDDNIRPRGPIYAGDWPALMHDGADKYYAEVDAITLDFKKLLFRRTPLATDDELVKLLEEQTAGLDDDKITELITSILSRINVDPRYPPSQEKLARAKQILHRVFPAKSLGSRYSRLTTQLELLQMCLHALQRKFTIH